MTSPSVYSTSYPSNTVYNFTLDPLYSSPHDITEEFMSVTFVKLQYTEVKIAAFVESLCTHPTSNVAWLRFQFRIPLIHLEKVFSVSLKISSPISLL